MFFTYLHVAHQDTFSCDKDFCTLTAVNCSLTAIKAATLSMRI